MGRWDRGEGGGRERDLTGCRKVLHSLYRDVFQKEAGRPARQDTRQ